MERLLDYRSVIITVYKQGCHLQNTRRQVWWSHANGGCTWTHQLYMLRIPDSSCLSQQENETSWFENQPSSLPMTGKSNGLHEFPVRECRNFDSTLVTRVCLKTQSSVLITWQLFYRMCKILITMSIMLSCSVSQHTKYVYKDMISGWGARTWLYHMNKGEGNERRILPFRSGRLRGIFSVTCEVPVETSECSLVLLIAISCSPF